MYHGQFNSPKVDEYIHKRFFSHNPVGLVCIEAGAEEGASIPSCKFFEQSLNWKCINVEPNPILFRQLLKNRPNSINLNYALVSPDLTDSFVKFQAYGVGLGYVIEETAENHKQFTEQYAGSIYPKIGICDVLAISYSKLIRQLNLSSVDLLVLDTEGSELKILEGLGESNVLPSVICVEDNLGEKQKFDSLLLPLGYKFDTKVQVNLHYFK